MYVPFFRVGRLDGDKNWSLNFLKLWYITKWHYVYPLKKANLVFSSFILLKLLPIAGSTKLNQRFCFFSRKKLAFGKFLTENDWKSKKAFFSGIVHKKQHFREGERVKCKLFQDKKTSVGQNSAKKQQIKNKISSKKNNRDSK